MKIFFMILFTISTMTGSILDQNFITVNNNSVIINNDADFYSYIDKLHDKNITDEYEKATQAINRIDNPYSPKANVSTYEEAFESLRFFYDYLSNQNSTKYINFKILKLKAKKEQIIAELLAANRNKLSDVSDVTLIVEYFQIIRNLNILMLEQTHMLQAAYEIVGNIWENQYKFQYDENILINESNFIRENSKTQNDVLKAIFINEAIAIEHKIAFIQTIKYLRQTQENNSWQNANVYTILDLKEKLSIANILSTSPLYDAYIQSLNDANKSIKNAAIDAKIIDEIVNYYKQPSWKILWNKFLNNFFVIQGEVLDYTLFIFDNNNVQVSDIVDFVEVIIITFIIQWILTWILHNKFKHGSSSLMIFIINMIFISYVSYYFATKTLGLGSTNFTIFASAFSLAIGFGMQSLIQNFIAGLIIIGDKTIQNGDFIMLANGQNGFVTNVNYRTTTLKTEDNIIITIPNSKIFQEILENKTSLDPKIRVKASFFVDKNANLSIIEDSLKKACIYVDGFVNEPAPELVISFVATSSIKLEFRLFVQSSSYDDVEKITKILYEHLQAELANNTATLQDKSIL